MNQLTLPQRYAISTMWKRGISQKDISEAIGVHPSTVSRELRRNCDKRNGKYDPILAEKKCRERHRKKQKCVCFTQGIKADVLELLAQKHSPEQISGRLKKEKRPTVSHETIYQYIWQDKKQGGTLHKHLRRKGKTYRKRGLLKDQRGQIPNRVSIHERPKIVDKKIRFGDIEVDLVVGADHEGALLTMNCRKTNFCVISKLKSQAADEVAKAVIEGMKGFPIVRTITSDNGKEFTLHSQIAEALTAKWYFADPYKSWQRGANENLNGLIRQYIPKKTHFYYITDAFVQKIQDDLNNRPRKKHGYFTPNELVLQYLKQTERKIAFIT